MDRGRAAGALLALAACIVCSAAAPTAGNQTALDLYDGPSDGCYYNFQHYGEGDRIMTNEPCLNCTCHNRMLMCYLRVCPFTKPIGQDCTVEKRADQCCPIVTCPDVPVDLLTSTSTTSPAEYGATGLGKQDKYGCSINDRYFPEGSKVPPSPNKPCEHCYCIRNMTTCVMQECTLHVDGCTPIYHKDVCCPVRYSCDHPEDEIPLLDDMSTTVRPTPGFLLTTTTLPPVTQMSQDCVHDENIFPDGALIKTEKACEHCYCMKGDIVCVVQECGTPMENEGKNCTSIPPREGQCCPDTYICEGDEVTTEFKTEFTAESITELTTVPPRRVSVEGSGYRNEDEPAFTEPSSFSEPEIEGSGDIQQIITPTDEPEKETSVIIDETEEPHLQEPSTPKMPSFEDTDKVTTEPDRGQNTVPLEDVTSEPFIPVQTTLSDETKMTEPDKETKEHEYLTTVSDFSSTLPDSSIIKDDENIVTTEQTLKKDEQNVVSPETSNETVIDKLITETLSDETSTTAGLYSPSTESIIPSVDNEFKSTSPSEYSEVTIQEKESTTEAALDFTTISEIATPEEEPIDFDAKKEHDITATTHKIELPEITSTIDTLENEIHEDITTTLSPSRIPGEGDCLLDGITYRNESAVPISNNCQTSCKCISSIIKCEPIICSPPPNYMDNCQPVFDSPESCCPAYVCDNVGETIPPQPHSQVSEIEHPVSSPTIECQGDECQVNVDKEKLPEVCKTENCLNESFRKPEQSDCGPSGCDIQIPTDSQTPPQNCVEGKCTSSEACAKGECQSPIIKDEEGCNEENGCQKLPIIPCDGDNCIITPSKDSSSQLCGNGEDCNEPKLPKIPIPPCEGESCIKEKCELGECDTEIKLTPPTIIDKECKGDECKQPIENEVEKECKDEYCRRKETQDVDAKPPVDCEGSACEPQAPLEPSKETTDYITTEVPQLEHTSKKIIEPSTIKSVDLHEITEPTDQNDLYTVRPDTDKTFPQESDIINQQTTTSIEDIKSESPKTTPTTSEETSHTVSPVIETQQMTTKAPDFENEPSVTEPYPTSESDLTSELPQDLVTEIDSNIVSQDDLSIENVKTETPESLITKLHEPTSGNIETVTEASSPDVMDDKNYTQIPLLEEGGHTETEQHDTYTEPSIKEEKEPLTNAPEVIELEHKTTKQIEAQEIVTKIPDVSVFEIKESSTEPTVSATGTKSTSKETEVHITTEAYDLEDVTTKGLENIYEKIPKTTESPEILEKEVTEYSVSDSTTPEDSRDETKSPEDYTIESIEPVTDNPEASYTKVSEIAKDQYDSSEKQESSTEEQKPIQSEVQESTTTLPQIVVSKTTEHPIMEVDTEISEAYVTQSSGTVPETPIDENIEYQKDTQTEKPEDVTDSDLINTSKSDDSVTQITNDMKPGMDDKTTDIPNFAVTETDTMSKPNIHEEQPVIVDELDQKQQEEIVTQLPDVTTNLLYTNVSELDEISTKVPIQEVTSKQEDVVTYLPDTTVAEYDLKPTNIQEVQRVSSKKPADDTTDQIDTATGIPQATIETDFVQTQEPELHEVPLEATTEKYADEQTDLSLATSTVTESTEMHKNIPTHSYENEPEIPKGSHESHDETQTKLPKSPEVEFSTTPESVQATQSSPESPLEVTTIKQEEKKPDKTSAGEADSSVPTMSTLYDSGHESTETSAPQDISTVFPENIITELNKTQTLSSELPVTESQDTMSKTPELPTGQKISTDSPQYHTEFPQTTVGTLADLTPEKDSITELPEQPIDEEVSRSPETPGSDKLATEIPESFVTVPLESDTEQVPIQTSTVEPSDKETETMELVSGTAIESHTEPVETAVSEKEKSSTDTPSYPKLDESIVPESTSSQSPLPQEELSVILESSTLEPSQPVSDSDVKTDVPEKIETNNLVTETPFIQPTTEVKASEEKEDRIPEEKLPHELEKETSHIPITEKEQAELETGTPVTVTDEPSKPSEAEREGTDTPDVEKETELPASQHFTEKEPEIEDYTKKPEDYNLDKFTVDDDILTEIPEILTGKPEPDGKYPESYTAVSLEEKPTEPSTIEKDVKTELPLLHVPEHTESVTKAPEELITEPELHEVSLEVTTKQHADEQTDSGFVSDTVTKSIETHNKEELVTEPSITSTPTEFEEKELTQTPIDIETEYPKISTSQPEPLLDDQKLETKLPELIVTETYATEKEEEPATQKPVSVSIDLLTTPEAIRTESPEAQKVYTEFSYGVTEQEPVTETSSSVITNETLSSEKPASIDIQPDYTITPESQTKPQDDTQTSTPPQEIKTEQPIEHEIQSPTTLSQELSSSDTKTPEKEIHDISTTERQEMLPTETLESQKNSTDTPENTEPPTPIFTQEASKPEGEYSTTKPVERVETTPYEIDHTQSIVDEITTNIAAEIKPHKPEESLETSTDNQIVADKVTETIDMKVTEEDEDISTPVNQYSSPDVYPTTLPTEEPSKSETQKETLPIPSTDEGDTKYDKEISTSVPLYQERDQTTPSEDEKTPLSQTESVLEIEKDKNQGTEKPEKVEVILETTAPEEEFIPATTKVTTSKTEDEVTTQSPTISDKFTKPEEKPIEAISSTATPEVSKPGLNDTDSMIQPTDGVTSQEEESHFPPGPTSGYDQEPDYVEEDQAFGPGTCRYGGKVYVSAQQIPRDDPCDFCFCFRSDIICLQQSCPPPIHGCHEEPIQGFCCPRYECPVSMATTLNVTTTTTTTTTTLPPHFLPHAYKGAAQRRGCQIKGHTYKVGEVVRASSGPCLHCTCGGDGQMKCDPKVCTPEPMLRQMIAAAVSSKRRR